MPCYSSHYPENEPQSNRQYGSNDYGNHKQLEVLTEANAGLININRQLEASLCAIITELKHDGIAEELLSRASRHGLIDLMQFWKEHEESDRARLAAELQQRFSIHEQQIIKDLLK